MSAVLSVAERAILVRLSDPKLSRYDLEAACRVYADTLRGLAERRFAHFESLGGWRITHEGQQALARFEETRGGTPRADCACRGYGCCACLSPIPGGGTCGSACAHFARCEAMFGQKAHHVSCQWIPSRFLARASAGGGR